MAAMKRIVIGISGASGSIYGVRLLQVLQGMPDIETHLVLSQGARVTLPLETEFTCAQVEAMAKVVHNSANLAAPISSGSFPVTGMVVAPCSMKSLAQIALALNDNLLSRAADVTLTDYGTVLATIPGTAPGPTVGFLAHVDTAPQFNATGVKPRVISGYNGGAISFPDNPALSLTPEDNPYTTREARVFGPKPGQYGLGMADALDDYSDEARKAAFADAREKAELYAGAAEIDLGSIRSINESTSYGLHHRRRN